MLQLTKNNTKIDFRDVEDPECVYNYDPTV